MFTVDMKPLLRQCDVGEINCYVCVGREACDKYPTKNQDFDKIAWEKENEPCWVFDNTFDTSIE